MSDKEQTINISDLRKLIPHECEIQFKRKKGQTGKWSLEIEVKMKPSMDEKPYYKMLEKIIAFYGEDLLEIYTEDTGYWFYEYLRMSSTVPTVVTP